MKIVLCLSLLLITMGEVMANSLTIKVQNIDINRNGQIIIFLFEKEGFPKKHSNSIQLFTHEASSNTLEKKFYNLPKFVAVKILHDENKDGKVTKNWTGIFPREGLGFSNNQSIGVFGPPTFKDCSFKLEKNENKTINIKLKYP